MRGYLVRKDYSFKRMATQKGFIVILSFSKIYRPAKNFSYYFKIKITMLTKKDMIKISLKDEQNKINTYIVEKMSEKMK